MTFETVYAYYFAEEGIIKIPGDEELFDYFDHFLHKACTILGISRFSYPV
jgi:hypothetical protein